jgi:hypothetical protein
MVEKMMDHIHRACVKALTCSPLRFLKPFLVNFSVPVFTPPPVLYIINMAINVM